MEKQKPWHLWLIAAVVLLTLYNILPTIFYYAKPLKSPITEERAMNTAQQIVHRVNDLEGDAKGWLHSFTKLLGLKANNIAIDDKDPGVINVSFNTEKDANLFKRFLPRAGALIPFVPSQLSLAEGKAQDGKTVSVLRQIKLHLNPDNLQEYFTYVPRTTADGKISPQYKELVFSRVQELVLALAGTSKEAEALQLINEKAAGVEVQPTLLSIASDIVQTTKVLDDKGGLFSRYTQNFLRGENSKELFTSLKTSLEALKKGELKPSDAKNVAGALAILEKNRASFEKGALPITKSDIQKEFEKSWTAIDPKDPVQILSLNGKNPFVKAIIIDWSNDKIRLELYPDIQGVRTLAATTEVDALKKSQINQALINEIARSSQMTGERIIPDGSGFSTGLTELQGATSFLSLNLKEVATQELSSLQKEVDQAWTPTSEDLKRENFPLMDYKNFSKLNEKEQKLGLVFFSPLEFEGAVPSGFRNSSLYIIARGMAPIIDKSGIGTKAPLQTDAAKELQALSLILQNKGFISYRGNSYGFDKKFSQDQIFELPDFSANLIAATRENFQVQGTKTNAVLDFTDVEQRLATINKIDDQVQESFVKWSEDYTQAQNSRDTSQRYDVPAPDKSPLWENLKLNMVKYFRGDESKVLKWGLDLSGGKTVRISLVDNNGHVVTNPEDLNQAVNELYNRINKMGVAERTIRVENNNIILDFPGSQAFSASELIKASAMYFHIVNEKFARNPELLVPVQRFLQNVWNEAVVTNQKSAEEVNRIAFTQLGGDMPDSYPRGDAAKALWESGLRLANPQSQTSSTAFNDTLSKVAVMHGDDPSEWQGQTHPLMIVFNNYALEGSSLTSVQSGYDPSQGNILTFSVKSSYEGKSGNPRDDFFSWTSQFSQDKIAGTPLEGYSKSDGWRMAVLLNERIVTSPRLQAALKDGGTISGHFTQREVAKLAADLKAGSLSFTPKILSEQNVSPELGIEERIRGISAALVGIVLVALAMIGYYRFAGVVATVAVLFNLIIMWGVLQNIGAALTLPGIAGIVLTIGMAVDANVLVFERFREEFKISGKVRAAMQAGYKKAFSAIVDSNITTILAALILIQFDSGPIKGFAVTLIIGIISSMFTNLFMTRTFFAYWVQNPKNTSLTFAEFVGTTKFDFLKQSRIAIAISVAIMVVGAFFFMIERNTIFGMDFTGGYSLNVEVEPTKEGTSPRLLAIEGLEKSGADSIDIQVRELSRPNQLRIQLGMGMERPGAPFYGMEDESTGEVDYEYLKHPKIVWTVKALESTGLKVQPSSLSTLHLDFSSMSGQFSSSMRLNATLALGFALLAILIYITLRFEFKFAVSAVIALIHDIAITLGIIGFLKWAGVAIQIDLEVVGAIMTIIGYSLNDTIIVFDRIREDLHLFKKLSYGEVINHAINVTLSRTVMTSGTTLLVLIPLVLFGGTSIFDFSLVMTIGVFIGTFSSLFIAGPCLLYFHNREEKKAEHTKALL